MAEPTAVVRAQEVSVLRVGTIVWLVSELLFFGGLFGAWFGLRAVNHPWPPADVELETVRTALFTVFLLASSATYHRAARAAEAGDEQGARRWTLGTFALGALFLANQAVEYAQADFGLSSHPFGSMFFVLTGFHGLHVLGGLVLMAVVLAVGSGATSRAPLGELVAASEYYWHFVDIVWVAVFTTVYVIR